MCVVCVVCGTRRKSADADADTDDADDDVDDDEDDDWNAGLGAAERKKWNIRQRSIDSLTVETRWIKLGLFVIVPGAR